MKQVQSCLYCGVTMKQVLNCLNCGGHHEAGAKLFTLWRVTMKRLQS